MLTNILIVEDENIIGMDLQNKLTRMGYSITGIATNSREAEQIILKNKPNLVLMDIVLKNGDDGISAAENIRQKYNIPVIFLTAYSDKETIERAKMSEPYGYIIKPYRERELSVMIEIALYKSRMNQELIQKQQELENLNKNLELIVSERTRNLENEIEERKKAEEFLRQNEEIFRDMAEFLPVILIEFDSDLNITYVNRTGKEIFGLESDDFIHAPSLLSFIPEEYHEQFNKSMQFLKRGEKTPLKQYRLIKKDHSIINTLVTSCPIYRNGRPLGFRSVIIDIQPFFFSAILPDETFFGEYSFTQREKEIFTLLAKGLKYREISDKLSISENTLKTHMSNIYDKMGIKSRDEIYTIIRDFQYKHVGRDRLFLSILNMLLQD